MKIEPQRRTRPTIPRRHVVAANLPRPNIGVAKPEAPCYEHEHDGLTPTGLPAFRSNGGTERHHPAKGYPFSFEVSPPDVGGQLQRVSILGVFALFADCESEGEGTFGASLQGYKGKDETFRYDLLNGKAYSDGRNLEPLRWVHGDGVSLETVGSCLVDGEPARVDLLTIDVPEAADVRLLRFKDMGSPASFVIFDVFLEFQLNAGCPFREHGGGVSLADLASVVRTGDRLRFNKALDQLDISIDKAEDLDEARGQSLTFLAVVTASTLEMGGPRSMVRVGLEAARELDQIESRDGIRVAIRRILESVANPLFVTAEGPSTQLIDRALALVERSFAKDLTDAMVADYLGLSTSHFRYLFRQATGLPFHRYLIGVRLEKAKQLLQDGDLAVSHIASLVGFAGLSHFSRAFSGRFSVSPTSIRRPNGAFER